MEKILVICAHPDDETLGLGGTIKLHSLNGSKVYVLNFADGESSRKKFTISRGDSYFCASFFFNKNSENEQSHKR